MKVNPADPTPDLLAELAELKAKYAEYPDAVKFLEAIGVVVQGYIGVPAPGGPG